ncbi:D-alanyl-D-alanine carboxypeptidase [Ferruginibacter paludis]|uniref:D-alanyl-D-alanine carboxypeptidase/D-alanyl-D-alanine-endopeptidase n=1 Tax=Ferruginibacter paludis TaxID=1310417 RepID=UPI0025B4DB2B|nr:D-alanyl-D-alanine carboxypeptidase [Ferruginibacter paludis]MDN3658386.1 D-alanyl-D-alanine carboxypeptidase [Ferruginibacter paludis]
MDQNKNNTSINFHGGIVVSQSFHPHTCVHLQPTDASVHTHCKSFFHLIFFAGISLFLFSCSVTKQINKQATTILFNDTIVGSGFTGISIYEPSTGKYWYNHDATKNFVPASNVKLFSLYAGLKYLGDSLTGLRYQQTDSGLIIYPTGDPSFLHPDFKQQPVFDFLKKSNNIMYCTQYFTESLGAGWAWDDYNNSYMVQRSEFPIYGNLARISLVNGKLSIIPKKIPLEIQKGFEKYGDSIEYSFFRKWDSNEIYSSIVSLHPTKNIYEIPLETNYNESTVFLSDTLQMNISLKGNLASDSIANNDNRLQLIHSQPADSLFAPMMHNSDNFFAEQTLLMASNEHLGYMSDDAIINTLLKTDLKDIPQQPKWVDGSGLSRYNLFSPQAMVYILDKMQTEFGISRLKTILPTGGTGTLKRYYLKDAGYIFAKTGSLSNVIALSGFLFTKKGKQIIFSVLVNNFQGSATRVRRAVEEYIEGIREKY